MDILLSILISLMPMHHVQDNPHASKLTAEQVKQTAKYHGTLTAFQGRDGQWYFKRGDQTCRLWVPKKVAAR